MTTREQVATGVKEGSDPLGNACGTGYARITARNGRRTVRNAVGNAGIGKWKKRTPGCNDGDTGLMA